MAIVLQQQGKPDAAMAMYQKALTIQLATVGTEHGAVGNTYINMAIVQKEQARYLL
jgi:hypothetical protein